VTTTRFRDRDAQKIKRRKEETLQRARPPSTGRRHLFAQVDGPLLYLPPLGTVLQQSPDEPPFHPSDPLIATIPVQRRLRPAAVAELATAYRQGVPVEELTASYRTIGRLSSGTSDATGSPSGTAGRSTRTMSVNLRSNRCCRGTEPQAMR
jgi:hypothetical protein